MVTQTPKDMAEEIARLQRVIRKTDPQRVVHSGAAYLHPKFRDKILQLKSNLEKSFAARATKTKFILFETYRSPVRQLYLYDVVPKVTKAAPWESAHQYGLAADFVASVAGQPSWDDDHDWPFLKTAAEQLGMVVPIDWDRGHVQSPLFGKIRGILV